MLLSPLHRQVCLFYYYYLLIIWKKIKTASQIAWESSEHLSICDQRAKSQWKTDEIWKLNRKAKNENTLRKFSNDVNWNPDHWKRDENIVYRSIYRGRTQDVSRAVDKVKSTRKENLEKKFSLGGWHRHLSTWAWWAIPGLPSSSPLPGLIYKQNLPLLCYSSRKIIDRKKNQYSEAGLHYGKYEFSLFVLSLGRVFCFRPLERKVNNIAAYISIKSVFN